MIELVSLNPSEPLARTSVQHSIVVAMFWMNGRVKVPQLSVCSVVQLLTVELLYCSTYHSGTKWPKICQKLGYNTRKIVSSYLYVQASFWQIIDLKGMQLPETEILNLLKAMPDFCFTHFVLTYFSSDISASTYFWLELLILKHFWLDIILSELSSAAHSSVPHSFDLA